MLKGKKITFIGAGFMAEALVGGLVASKSASAGDITVTDIRDERLKELSKAYGVNGTGDNKEAVKTADVVVVAVKPQDIMALLGDIGAEVKSDAILISIAAGVKIGSIAEHISGRIVRAMPNTCAQVGEAVTAVAFNEKVSGKEKELALSFFSSVGKAISVKEDMMDAVTAVSGSGPAYIYLVMESMIKAGVDAGLSKDESRLLVLQTVKGSAELVLKSGEEPATLRERVTSPNGTTYAALQVLENNGVRDAFGNAVKAAINRSKELG